MRQLHWVDLVSKASNRHEIDRVIRQLLTNEFQGKIVAFRPYIGGGKGPESLVRTTVEFQFVGVEQDMNKFVSALQSKFAQHNIILVDWSDDDDVLWSFWSWIKSLFRDITLQHR